MDKDTITLAKLQSLRLSTIYREWAREEHLDAMAARADRVAQCSTVWSGYICPDCGRLHGMISYGCHDRLCPICAAKRARASAAQALQVMPLMRAAHPEAHWALITLTQRNVCAADLSQEIDRLLAAWAALRHMRAVQRVLLGWARNIEITYNAREDTYHPHIHIIAALGAAELCNDSAWWAGCWRDALGLDYMPVCDARPMVQDSAVREVSKYVLKMSSVYRLPMAACTRAIHAIWPAIYGRRLKSYGGCWLAARKAARMMDVDQLDDGQLEAAEAYIDGTRCECGSTSALVPYTLMWAGMEYQHVV